ncbi:hypothetical protein [Sphingosinicella sp. BN140058]|uniref:hypothetical protein n=1 Tax=Sphingosinicella sp. BN140058 TaxID=1892855 RepID=UPI001012C8E2|nr:hypothetical protein [Sphingosinicella sp. BN140058]QAY75878.1 hypothetical protein ETR14_04530 [Sphingosinicella sp. BN140058]
MDTANGLSPAEKRSLRTIAFALDRYEPFVAHSVPERTLRHLLDEGLASEGPSSRPAVGEKGYKLTDRGWDTVRQVWTR